jgi:hypothetical protein
MLYESQTSDLHSFSTLSSQSKLPPRASFWVSLEADAQCPNVSTTPLWQWGFRQCLPFSWTTLRDKHCWHPIAVMGVVECRYVRAIFVLFFCGLLLSSETIENYCEEIWNGDMGGPPYVTRELTHNRVIFFLKEHPYFHAIVIWRFISYCDSIKIDEKSRETTSAEKKECYFWNFSTPACDSWRWSKNERGGLLLLIALWKTFR